MATALELLGETTTEIPQTAASLLGEQPVPTEVSDQPDIIGRAKSYLTQEPQPGERSAFGEPEIFAPVGSAIREAGRLLLPGSIPEAAIQAGIGWAGGKIIPTVVENVMRAFRAVRPLAKEVAQTGLAKLLPEEALQAKLFYEAADLSNKTIPISGATSGAIRSRKFTTTASIPHTFAQAQEAIQNLRLAANSLMRQGRTAAAKTARDQVNELTDQVDKVFPGFKQAQTGYAKLKDIGLVQEMVNKSNPLNTLELDIAKGQVMGPEGLLMKGGGRATRWLGPDELKEAKTILEKLGPEPGNTIIRQMVEGRAIGGTIGGLLGYQHGGIRGAAEGAALGIAGPKAINWIIGQSLKHPMLRNLLKQSLESPQGLTSPALWRNLSMLGTRLGLNMISPDPEDPQEMAQIRALDAVRQGTIKVAE